MTQPSASNSLHAQTSLDQADLLALDYAAKVSLLEAVVKELLDKRLEYARIAGRYAELRADIQVLGQVKSALQSAIKADM